MLPGRLCQWRRPADPVRNGPQLHRPQGPACKALYEEDKNLPLRKSHESPLIKLVYDEYLGEPGSHKAHELLHTSYVARKEILIVL